jgi:hypothetical protein
MSEFPTAFLLRRTNDPTGISGTGVVAEGVIFQDSTVALRWLPTATSRADKGVMPTTVLHDDIRSVVALHGHGDSTVVEYEDGATLRQTDLEAAMRRKASWERRRLK